MNVYYFGGEAKALGDGRVGGYLVRYGDKDQTDLVKDFFTPSTDYDVDWSSEVKSTVYYNHGLDKKIGKTKLCNGAKATLKKDDIGIWIEAQLDLRNEYEKAIYGLVEQKKLGWSSGTVGYLVEREKVGDAFEIKRWGLGLDASLTPTPAEPRNVAEIKSLEDLLGSYLDESLTWGTLCSLVERFIYLGIWEILYDDISNDEKIAKIETAFNDLAVKGTQVAKALLTMGQDELSVEYNNAKALYYEPSEKIVTTLKSHIEYVNKESKELHSRLNIIKEVSKDTAKSLPLNKTNGESLHKLIDEMITVAESLKSLTEPQVAAVNVEASKLVSEFLVIQSEII